MDSESDTPQRRMQNARRRDAGALYLCLSLSATPARSIYVSPSQPASTSHGELSRRLRLVVPRERTKVVG